ncbi:MAG: hypothetical protein GXY50_06765 [Syntrophomonadaceae bacterium]|nr:hypothetical protein [Syntrophomonadaceae bacterium]
MCELLGISSNKESNIQFSEQVMQADSQNQPDGWGVAFYPEELGFCQVFKEPKAMKDSDLFRYLQEKKTIRSRIILNHIRYAVGGKHLYSNTHPFVRELFGRDWVLIHNGASGIDKYYRNYIKPGEKQRFVPIGTTGSEKALCIILNDINNKVSTKLRLEEGSNLRIKGDYDFGETQRVIYETCQSIQDSGASLNILLSNGEYLMAFHSGHNHLHYVLRDGRTLDPGAITLNASAEQYFYCLGQNTSGLHKPSDEKAAIVATERLTKGEQWRKFNKGDFLVFKDGELAFQNGNPKI